MSDRARSAIKSWYLYSFMRRLLLLTLTVGISIPLVACGPKKETSLEPVVVETLISTTESWNGDSFKYPRGQAEMKLEKITAQPGFKTPLSFTSTAWDYLSTKRKFFL